MSQQRSATVSAFPPARRRDLVAEIAAGMAARPPEEAERYVKQQIRRQARALRRKQVSEQEIEREARHMESAVRAELWRQVIICPPQPTGGHR